MMKKEKRRIYFEWLIVLALLIGSIIIFDIPSGILIFLSIIFLWFFGKSIRSYIMHPKKGEGLIWVLFIIYIIFFIIINIKFLERDIIIFAFWLLFGSYLFYVGLTGVKRKELWLRGFPLGKIASVVFGWFIIVLSLLTLLMGLVLGM